MVSPPPFMPASFTRKPWVGLFLVVQRMVYRRYRRKPNGFLAKRFIHPRSLVLHKLGPSRKRDGPISDSTEIRVRLETAEKSFWRC